MHICGQCRRSSVFGVDASPSSSPHQAELLTRLNGDVDVPYDWCCVCSAPKTVSYPHVSFRGLCGAADLYDNEASVNTRPPFRGHSSPGCAPSEGRHSPGVSSSKCLIRATAPRDVSSCVQHWTNRASEGPSDISMTRETPRSPGSILVRNSTASPTIRMVSPATVRSSTQTNHL